MARSVSVTAVDSPTGAMSDFYARRAQQMDAARAALASRPGQVGAVPAGQLQPPDVGGDETGHQATYSAASPDRTNEMA